MTRLTEYVMTKGEVGPTGLVTFTLSELSTAYPNAVAYSNKMDPAGYVVVDVVDNFHVYFASLDWVGNITGEEDEYTLLFCGWGLSGGLRELRHTYWGERGCGYLFDPRPLPIAETFRILEEWFGL